MYAIIEDGSKQFIVKEGDRLDLELHDLAEGQETLQFDKVLLVRDGDRVQVGRPYVAGAKVTAEVQGELRGAKIDIVKFRRRKGYHLKKGHRQDYLRVTITKIEA